MSEQQRDGGEPLLEVRHVKKYFPIRKGVLQREVARVHAVDDVTFARPSEGETLGLVGESGCGKSTLGRTIVRLLEPTAGQIIFEGEDISRARHARRSGRSGARCRWSSRIRTRSLNPRKRVGSIIGDPLQDPQARRRPSGSSASRSSSRPSASRRSTTTASRTSSPAASGSGSGSRGRSRCGRS